MSDVPSIIEQAYPWRAGFFNFGKAKRPEVTYFNCCIHPRADSDWLIVRRSVWRHNFQYGLNTLMAFRLNSDLVPQVGFKIKMPGSETEHFEDPRCVMHNGSLWISCCNFLVFGSAKNQRWTGAHQIIAQVSDDWKSSKRYDPQYGKNGPSMFTNKSVNNDKGDVHEKNWLWFSHEGNLHLIYSAMPHLVVRWTEDMKPADSWQTITPMVQWKMGEIRGGTTPVLVGREYWTFFHSSLPWQGKKRQYHMGAYAFEAHPPFRITKITTRPLLTGSPNDYWLPGKPACIFPCGALIRNGKWLVVGGSNDLECFHFEIPHADLVKRMESTLDPAPQKKSLLTKATELLTSAP
jgi:predicted GH43/DUF377 family glycosyl hydrolase